MFNLRQTRKAIDCSLTPAAKAITQFCRSFKVPLFCDVPHWTDIEVDEMREHVGTFEKLHENEIENGVRILHELVHNSNPVISALGAVQSGKTNAAFLAIALYCVYLHLNGKRSDYLCLVPGDFTIRDTTQQSWKAFTYWYGRLQFRRVKECVTFRDLVHNHLNNKDKDKMVDHKIYPLTNNQDALKKIKDYIAHAEKQKVHSVIVVDEAQHGDGKDGIADRTFGETLKNGINGTYKYTQFVFLSATPWPYHNLAAAVHLKPGKNYVGFNMHEGRLIDASVPVKTPNIIGFSEFIAQRDLSDCVSKISIPAYFDSEKYNGLLEKTFEPEKPGCKNREENMAENRDLAWELGFGPRTTHVDYVQKVRHTVQSLIHAMILGQNRMSHGCMIRVISDNKRTRQFVQDICLDDSIVSIELTEKKSFKQFVDEVKSVSSQGRPFVVLVTGKARKSNRIPKEIGCFIELTEHFTTATAAIQGLPGRASGYKGVLPVVVSDRNAEAFRIYVSTLGRNWPGPVHMRARQNSTRARCNEYLSRNDKRDAVVSLFKRWDAVLTKPPTTGRIVGSWYKWSDLFPESILVPLEKCLGGKILRLGERTTYKTKGTGDRRLYHQDGEMIFVAYRSVDADGQVRNQDSLSRSLEKDFRKKNTGVQRNTVSLSDVDRGIEPHAQFDPKTGTIWWIALAYRDGIAAHREDAMPTKKSMHSHFLQYEEEEEL